jgi:hypothetical protein
MARVRSNPIVQGLSGGLGNLMFRRLRDGRTILCVKPDFSNRKLSEEQQAHHRRFREGAAHARQAAKTEPLYAELAAGTMKTAYNIALADWFHPPVIHEVALDEGRVRVYASDNVRVAGVRVSILDEQGKLLEQGEAAGPSTGFRQAQPTSSGCALGWWVYTPGRLSGAGEKLVVEARDLAGNVTRAEK